MVDNEIDCRRMNGCNQRRGLVYLGSRARLSHRGGEVDLFSVRLLPAFSGH